MSASEAPPPSPPRVESRPPVAAHVFGSTLALADRYVALLAGPGVQRGLLGPREPGRLWTRHVLNSAALANIVPTGAVVLDIGSGAGLPGIPLALARPDLQVTLVEPMARRVAFLHEVVRELDIPVGVHHGRADTLPAACADVVVARAVAPLATLLGLTLPLLKPAGRLLALKGGGAATEIAAARSVLKHWPAATVSLVTVPTGAATATVVSVALDGDHSTEEDRER